MRSLDIMVKTTDGGIKIPDNVRMTFNDIVDFCNKNRGGYVHVKISPPVKKRTTGPKSQSHHINGHVQQICNETGEDFDVIKTYAKRKAIKRGYPTRVDAFKNTVPLSETEIDTFQAGFLIDSLHEMAAWLELVLREDS